MKKRLIYFVLFAVCVVSLTACGGKNNPNEATKNYVFNELLFEDTEATDTTSLSAFLYNGTDIYYDFYQYPDYDDSIVYDKNMALEDISADNEAEVNEEDIDSEKIEDKTIRKIKKYNIETGEITEVFDASPAAGFEDEIRNFYVAKDGRVSIVFDKWTYDEKTDQNNEELIMHCIDKDGKKLSEVNITDKFKNFDPETCFFNYSFCDNEDNIYLGYSDGQKKMELLSFDPEGNVVGNIPLEKPVDSIMIDSKNNFIATYFEEDGNKYAYIDPSTGRIKEEITGITVEQKYAYYEMVKGDELNELYLKDSNALYSYNNADKTKKSVLKWIDCGIVGENVINVFPMENGKFLCILSDDQGKNSIGIIEETDGPVEQRTEIKMAMSYIPNNVKEQIIKFNKENDKYKIDYIDYESEDNPSEKIGKDIIAGNIPDIIGTSNINLENYIAKGILEDLLPYMEKDDYLNTDYFIDGLIDNMKTDGKIYSIVQDINVMTAAGKKSSLSKYADGWTISDFIKYYKTLPKGTKFTEYDTKTSVFYYLCALNLNSFIDWNTGEVKFDDPEFKELLSFCNAFPSEEEYNDSDYDYNTYKLIKKGKLILEMIYLYNTENIQLTNKLFEGDELYIGYPCNSGYGSFISANYSYGIAADSPNKDGAWEFIKYLFKNCKQNDGIPTGKEDFDKMMEKEMATKKYKDEDGNVVEPRNYETQYGKHVIKITPATQKDVDTLKEIIKKSKFYSGDSSAFEMINEDVEKYFNKTKSLDETVKIIQDKMTKYVNENK